MRQDCCGKGVEDGPRALMALEKYVPLGSSTVPKLAECLQTEFG